MWPFCPVDDLSLPSHVDHSDLFDHLREQHDKDKKRRQREQVGDLVRTVREERRGRRMEE
jgi:hypothetical protein